MSSLVFLIAFVVLSVIGGFVLWLRERSPSSMEHHMREFQKEREALSPDSWTAPDEPRRRRLDSAFGPRRPDSPPRTRGPRSG